MPSPAHTAYVLAGVNDSMSLSEHHLYGSSRLGAQRYDSSALRNVYDYYDSTQSIHELDSDAVWYSYWYNEGINRGMKEPWGNSDTSMSRNVSRLVGHRYYELADHLGNMLATVLDRKTGILASGSSTLYDRWKADITSLTDYYPFGMEMVGRTYSASIGLTSKFGFNGKLKDNEIAGVGNSYDYGMRMYNPRLGRFPSPDPLASEYPELTPYQYASNNPVQNIDIDGLEGGDANIVFRAAQGRTATKVIIDQTIKQGAARMAQGAASSGGSALGRVASGVVRTGGGAVAGTVALVFMSGGGEGISTRPNPNLDAGIQYSIGLRTGLQNYLREQESQESITLYRGVSKEIDVPVLYSAAKRGFAVPRGFLPQSMRAHDNKNAHTGSDNNSIYTSWLAYKYQAEKFAKGKSGTSEGVILEKTFKRSEVSQSALSQTEHFEHEGEYLVPGVTATPNVQQVSGK